MEANRDLQLFSSSNHLLRMLSDHEHVLDFVDWILFPNTILYHKDPALNLQVNHRSVCSKSHHCWGRRRPHSRSRRSWVWRPCVPVAFGDFFHGTHRIREIQSHIFKLREYGSCCWVDVGGCWQSPRPPYGTVAEQKWNVAL